MAPDFGTAYLKTWGQHPLSILLKANKRLIFLAKLLAEIYFMSFWFTFIVTLIYLIIYLFIYFIILSFIYLFGFNLNFFNITSSVSTLFSNDGVSSVVSDILTTSHTSHFLLLWMNWVGREGWFLMILMFCFYVIKALWATIVLYEKCYINKVWLID